MAKYGTSQVRDRIKIFAAHKYISVRKFQDLVGVSNSFVASIDQSISPKTQAKISAAFPELNIDWLLTGNGEMLLTAPETTKEAPSYVGGAVNNIDMQNTEHEAFLQQLVNRLMAVNEAQSDELKKVRVLLEQQAAKLREMESALGCLPAHRDDSVSEGNIPIGSVG